MRAPEDYGDIELTIMLESLCDLMPFVRELCERLTEANERIRQLIAELPDERAQTIDVPTEIAKARVQGAIDGLTRAIEHHDFHRGKWRNLRETYASLRDAESFRMAEEQIVYHGDAMNVLKMLRARYEAPEPGEEGK